MGAAAGEHRGAGILGRWKQGICAVLALGCILGTSGCQRLLMGPKQEAEVRPDQVMDFDHLYGQNCAACHGADGKNGPAMSMNNPLYMGLASDQIIRNYVANGGPGALSPAFAKSAGGLLTDDQVNAIVVGMRKRWAKPAMLVNVKLPPYAASGPGNVAHGGQVYAAACASCHGAAGADGLVLKPGKAGSITDPTYLDLISDQGLRTIVIAGRPDLGQPDFRGDIPGRALTDTEITDVVAWLDAHRLKYPGSPHPAGQGATELQRRTQ